MKKWENPIIDELSITKTREGNVCPGYRSENEPMFFTILEDLAPYCECETCDGITPPKGHSVPANQPCAFRYTKPSKGCSA